MRSPRRISSSSAREPRKSPRRPNGTGAACVGGPIVQEQGALLRQPRAAGRQPEPHAACSRRSPEYNYAIVEESVGLELRWFASIINSASRTPGRCASCGKTAPQGSPVVPNARTLPESFQDETDIDQTAVGTLTSVIGGSRVNTCRLARTWEHWWHGNACFRASVRRRATKV